VIRALAVSVVGAVALACALAPIVHLAAQSLDPPPRWPYSRVFDRTAMAALVVLLVAFRRRLELHRLAEPFRSGSRWRRAAAFAFGLGLAAAGGLAVVPLLVRAGGLTWGSVTPGWLASRMLAALPAAAAVSVVEEAFFRLLVFGGLKRRLPVAAAAVASSMFYAAIHFLAPARDFQVTSWSPGVGFEYLGRILSRYALPSVLAGMVGLFLMGLVLCAVLERTRSIMPCVGLHAGWFFAAKAAVFLTDFAPEARLPGGVNERYYMVGQPVAWLSIVAVGAVAWIAFGRRAQRGEETPAKAAHERSGAPGKVAPG
jgi:membrane protease YdiL (CAAX protease family)